MTVGGITSTACPVATNTDTPNPSFTATNTPVPVTGTPTAIPTHTPLPSGHSTFTATNTPLPGSTHTPTGTPTNTPTPGPSFRQCGIDYPMLNCDMVDGSAGVNPTNWTYNHDPTITVICGNHLGFGLALTNPGPTAGYENICSQTVVPVASGQLWIRWQAQGNGNHFGSWRWFLNDTSDFLQIDSSSCTMSSGTFCTAHFTSNVISGVSTSMNIAEWGGGVNSTDFRIDNMWISSTGNTPTPAPTGTDTVTPTPVPGTPTDTPIPTDTLVPIPGAMSTGIPTSTECPGGCAVSALTAIPGLATITTVDTSPFSQLQHLSLARNGCTAFGYVQIPMPVIHGTPALGTTNPLSVTWTLPITHDWDNTHPYSNTAIEPCAMDEIPTFVWDFTYWLSVFGAAVVWIMWMIGLVGRLSGDETING
jgi:hypothetical protein